MKLIFYYQNQKVIVYKVIKVSLTKLKINISIQFKNLVQLKIFQQHKVFVLILYRICNFKVISAIKILSLFDNYNQLDKKKQVKYAQHKQFLYIAYKNSLQFNDQQSIQKYCYFQLLTQQRLNKT
ncbi:hypothetical protein IMG5_090250 [Ichthyophthirius multifiliis]|uniref:Uncharacterized protein n=1 Tax=Ichthyophthirius multifiliis TaxID=5932 RepID=G0QR79_ICHMU|nr:hypothetical protein IMG5_090250 [Ichthyophthirius multifiliis]EGR32277.1 hypothetical protein IMG5_090250 [Ichthyophthirius multifiliis]|eukprot:XP_004035763.1 hypothetical protein IMG5_090250 [Ichthyophthirius multifiliis]